MTVREFIGAYQDVKRDILTIIDDSGRNKHNIGGYRIPLVDFRKTNFPDVFMNSTVTMFLPNRNGLAFCIDGNYNDFYDFRDFFEPKSDI